MRTFRAKLIAVVATIAMAGIGAAQVRNKSPRSLYSDPVAVRVDERGITPGVIQRPEGAFLLCIKNRRGNHAEHFYVTLDSPGSTELLSIDTTPKESHVDLMLDLEPGNYRLHLTQSPDLSVGIQIRSTGAAH